MRRQPALVLPVLLALFVSACSAPSPGDIEVRSRSRDASAKTSGQRTGTDAAADDGAGDDDGADDDGAGDNTSPAGDAGVRADGGAIVDAAADAPAVATNPFAGAPAYVATLGPVTRKPGHNFVGNTPPTNPAGQPCLSCHGPGAAILQFGFAGTVYTTPAAATPAARVEVRLRDKNGKALSGFSDADGNFFVPLNPNGDFIFPASTSARDGTTTHPMVGTILNGNCNSCHSPGGGQARIYLP